MIVSFDLLETGLALCLGAVALACLFDRHLVRACGLFVVFALLMTAAWWQLGAPWLAIAELVLGVMLTGASFFYALDGVITDKRSMSNQAALVARYDHFRGSWLHRLTRGGLMLAWCVMVGGAIRFMMPEMAYSPTEHPLILVAIAMAATAMGAFALHHHLLRRLLAFNILGSSVFLLLAGLAGTAAGAQALIGVGLVVAGLGSLLGTLLIRRLLTLEGGAALALDGAVARSGR